MIYLHKNIINLYDSESKQTQGLLLQQKLMGLFQAVFEQVQNGTFDYTGYSFGRQIGSSLTYLAGFYMIINKSTKQVYLGCSHNLGQRKGEYGYNLKNNRKVYGPMRADLAEHGADSFYFVPLCGITRQFFPGLRADEDVTGFLQTYVEGPALTELIAANSPYKAKMYNAQTGNLFEPGNAGGGLNEGLKLSPLRFGNEFAWPSLSLAAKCFNRDRTSIRKQRDKGNFVAISKEEFDAFEGVKITYENVDEILQIYRTRFDEISGNNYKK